MLFEADAIELPPSDDEIGSQEPVFEKNHNKPLQVIRPGGGGNQKSTIKVIDNYPKPYERGRSGRPNEDWSDMPLQYNVSPVNPDSFSSENSSFVKPNFQKTSQQIQNPGMQLQYQGNIPQQQRINQNYQSPPPNINNPQPNHTHPHINSSSKKLGAETPAVVHLSLKDMKKDLNNSGSRSSKVDTSGMSNNISGKKGRPESNSSQRNSASKPSPKRHGDSEGKPTTDRSASNKTSETPERNNEMRVSFTTAQTSRKSFRLSKEELDTKSDDYKELYFFYEQEMNENTYLRNVLKKETLCSEEQRALIEVLKSVIEEKAEENPLSELLMSFKNSASDQCRNIDIFIEYLKFREDYERKCQINSSLEEKLTRIESENNQLLEKNENLLYNCQTLSQQMEKTKLMNDELIRECDGLSQLINKHDETTKQKDEQLSKLQNENSDLNRKLSVLSRDMERLQKKKEEQEAFEGIKLELEESKEKIKKAKADHESLSIQITQLVDIKRQLELRIGTLERDKAEIIEKNEKQIHELLKKHQDGEAKTSYHSKELHEKDSVIAALRSDVKLLREKLDETKRVYEALSDIQEEKKFLEEKMEEEATRVRIIEREIQLSKHSKEGLVEANETLKKEIDDISTTRDELRERLENERRSKAQELTKTMEEMSRLRMEMREINEQRSKWLGEKEQLLEELRETEAERNELLVHLKSLENQIKDREKTILEYEDCLSRTKLEYEELIQERNDLERKFDLACKENNSLLHERSKGHRDKPEKSQYESLQAKYQELKQEFIREKSSTSSNEKLLAKVNKALKNINTEIKNQLGKKVDILKLDFSLDLSGIGNEVIGSLDDLKNLVSLCLAELEISFNEKTSLKSKLQELGAKLKQTESKYKYLKESLGKENNRIEMKKMELNHHEQEKKELKRKNQILTSGLEEYSEERQKIVDEIKSLKRENGSLKHRLNELGKENEFLTKSIEGTASVQEEKRSFELKILEEKSHKLKFERNILREILEKSTKFITNFEIKNIISELREVENSIYDEEKLINDVVGKIEELLSKENEKEAKVETQGFMITQLKEQLSEREEKLRNLMHKKDKFVETLDDIYQSNRFASQGNEEIQRLTKENSKLKNDLNCMKNELEIKKLAIFNSKSEEDSFQRKYFSNNNQSGALNRIPRDVKRSTWADEFSVETKENFNDNMHHVRLEENHDASIANDKSMGQNSSFQKMSSAGSIKKQKKDAYA